MFDDNRNEKGNEPAMHRCTFSTNHEECMHMFLRELQDAHEVFLEEIFHHRFLKRSEETQIKPQVQNLEVELRNLSCFRLK